MPRAKRPISTGAATAPTNGRRPMLRKTLLATAAVLAFASAAAAQDKLKACFVYVGPIGDGGWTFQHDQGRLDVEKAFGDKVETAYQENVPEGADAERVLTQMALSGCKIIFTTSFGYMDATNAVAAKFPDIMFEHATGYKRDSANVSTYNARFYEGRAVTGTIAGRMTKSKPSPRVSAIIDIWGPYYVERVGALLDGTHAQKDTRAGIGGGKVLIGEITDAVPAEVKAEAEA